MKDAGRLIAAAREVAEHSYSPYSGYRVGAIAVTPDGDEYAGCNVENAAFPSTICAEGNAISTAVAAGVREIDTIAVTCLDGPECTPCGNCRQMMREFNVRRVILTDGSGDPVEYQLEDLLPHSFGPEDLPNE